MNTPMLLRMGVAKDMSSLRPTLQNCLETVLSVSDSMVDDLLDGLAMAAASEGIAQPHGRLEPALVRCLLSDVDAMKRTWQSQLRHALYHGGQMAAVSSAPTRFDDLRLLDEQQIDASIGFALAEQEFRRASAEQLPMLNVLVSSLMGWLTVQADINPLKPAAFACALRDLLTHHVSDVAQRNAMLAPAAGAMGESLRQVYRQLIQWLLVHGVEPLDVQASGPKGAPAPRSPLGQEVVRLMLDNLTQDERLLPAIRQQIGLMEPVLIELSHADPRFFSERQHPARQLLEVITQRSLGYLSQNDEGFADLLRSVVAAVKAIRRAPATEDSFARLLQRLRRYWDEDDARKSQMRTEAARALLHAEQRHLLAERLAADFHHRIADKALPDFVVDFLCRPWAQAVAQAQLAGTLDAADGSPLTSVADDLIWCAQTHLIQRDRSRLARLMPRLLGQLRHALLRIEYPTERIGTFFDALVALQERAFEPPVAPVELSPSCPAGLLPPQEAPTLVDRFAVPEANATVHIESPIEPAVEPTAETAVAPMSDAERPDIASAVQPSPTSQPFWMADSEAQHAGYVAVDSGPMPLEPLELSSTELLPGAWVDLLMEGEWVRAQLTWASPHGTLFMFVSAKGLAHSMTRRTLERLRNTDVLRVVSRSDVVEGALDAVAAQALRNTGAQGAGV